MATVKLNSRSPYFIVASGTEGCGDEETQSISISGPNVGIVNSDITLSVVANNFTPVSYAWTGGAAAGSTLKEITFTETSSGEVDYGVTATSNCGTQYTATIKVNWNTVTQYTATLTVDNQIVGPSNGYTIGGNKNGAKITGISGDPYSFTTTLTLNSGYTADVALAISPTQPNAGTFASSDVSVTTTLTGTVSLNDEYYLSRSASSVIEGDTFTIGLTTKNLPDGTSVPFTITGVQAADLKRNTTFGAFIVKNNAASQLFEVQQDLSSEPDETFTLTLNNVLQDGNPVNISVLIRDKNVSQAQDVLLSESTFDNRSNACDSTVTTTEDAHYGLAPGETFGNGTVLFKDMLLSQKYPSAGKFYKILYNNVIYNARIGANNQGEITEFAECAIYTDKEKILDTTPEFTCAIAGITIYQGVVGEPLNYKITNGVVTLIDKPNYVLGTTNYVFSIRIPSGYKNAGTIKECSVSGTGISSLPVWTCTNTALNVIDGATGDGISYSYSSEIKASDIVSIKNSSGGSVYVAGSDTYTLVHKIPTGYQGAGTNISCTDTATGTTTPIFTCDIAQFYVPNGIVGGSVLAVASTQKGDTTSVSPSAYLDGNNIYTGTIEIPSGYSNYPGTINCDYTAYAEEKVLPPSNSLTISVDSVDSPGSLGDTVCNLEADKIVYYQGTIGDLTQLFTNRELTSVFGGTDKWHKLKILNPDGELINWYAQVYSYPAGQIQKLTQCGFNYGDNKAETGGTATPTVVVSASSSDGDNVNAAFTYQKVTLTATVAGLDSSPSYQWYRGTASQGGTGNLTLLSGETNSTLVINDGGQTQTTTGYIYYNCLVKGTYEDDQNYLIVWDDRLSYSVSTTYTTSGSADINSCTSTDTQTLYPDREGTTAFCTATKFYTDAAGTTLATGGRTYSDGTNFRYIEINGTVGGCVPYGCAGPPVTQPTTNIQKLLAQRCDDGSLFEYFLFDGFEYDNDYILDIKDVGQTNGRGCYKIIYTYSDTYTLPDGYFKIEQTDLERSQPYTNCTECQGQLPVEEEEEVVIQKYYARFIKCGTDGGDITAVSSTAPISTSLVLQVGNECREYLDNVEIVDAPDISLFTTFFGCQACLDTITPTVEEQDPESTLGFFRTYGDCATGGSDVQKDYGSTTNLGSNWPAVILDSGLCLQDLGTSGTTSTVNISTLLTFENCDECDLVVNPPAPPAPEEEVVVNKFQVSSTTETTASNACNNITLFDVKLAYSGTLQDGTYLYLNEGLTSLYTPASTNFVKSSNGYTFRIGVTNPGQISELKLCSEL